MEPKWGRVWALTLLVVATSIGAWELIVRDADLGPRYVDNKVLWADTRHRLNEEGDDAIVLIGASRMLRGVNVETMKSAVDRPVYQLSVEGTSYLPLLQNLGADPRIRGSVVVSIAPAFTFNRLLNQGDMGIQSIYLDYYDSQSYARRLEQRLRMWVQGMFAFRSPDSKLAVVIPELLTTGSLPAPNWQRMYRYCGQLSRKQLTLYRRGVSAGRRVHCDDRTAADCQGRRCLLRTLAFSRCGLPGRRRVLPARKILERTGKQRRCDLHSL